MAKMSSENAFRLLVAAGVVGKVAGSNIYRLAVVLESGKPARIEYTEITENMRGIADVLGDAVTTMGPLETVHSADPDAPDQAV